MVAPDAKSLARHYPQFNVTGRALLTGHSHQAWPDVARAAQLQAWDDAALHVDDKWDRAFQMADRVRRGYASRLDDPDGEYVLAANTHELLVRFLSALPLGERPRLVTTDGEFHTIRRQLQRLAEEGMPVTVVPTESVADLPDRLISALDDRTAAVLVSCVLFRNGRIVRGLGEVAKACRHHGVELLVDAYHAVNVVPFSLRREGLMGAYVVGGGYKYCQGGEGNAFLRLPQDCALRPVVTGWFAEFERLAEGFDKLYLDPAVIRRDRETPLSERGGFLVLDTPHAATLCRELRERDVWVDHRDGALRLGPAPYVSDRQLEAALDQLARCIFR